ncbi:MAG: valine--tRNA ligase [Candidatus Ratteibacteria bacterium]|jgi:valyl-tRNA synthetase
MEKQYSAKEVEEKWLKIYRENEFFRADVDSPKKSFVIVIPPPNVTGVLHIGHALNTTIQDVLIRQARMSGLNTLWIPGTDHAGIATQNVVERSLLEKGQKRDDLGRDKFIEKVWRWKEERGGTIIEQLKKLGASCDWQRERFTMDEGLSAAVSEAFVSLYQKGLIYRGNYIVNWCPRCTTALANEEVDHETEESHLYYIRYPGEGGTEGVVVATTRPETLFGDTAIAVNPKDIRYKKIVGKKVFLPILNRLIPIVAHPMVEKGFGTGAVKITPHHDPNDFKMARDLNLPGITVIDEKGILTKEAGPLAGKERFAAREETVALLKENGLLVKVEDYQHSVGRCYRCETVVEPYLSKQWFVRMKPLAKPTLVLAKKNKPKFYPARWQKVYRMWLENIEDWCISRQIWWGHRLPVYYCQGCLTKNVGAGLHPRPREGTEPLPYTNEKGIIVSKTKPDKCPNCGSINLTQDPDVLDTWFSSWLWPYSVLGWPEKTKDLEIFYPTKILVTAPEIIFFWVARMAMSGLEFTGKLPFEQVYIHGTVRDETGRKMSKSYGNVIDPLEIINEVGADSLRFSLISFASQGQDLFIGRKSFTLGRNFANKIWNASRLVIGRVKEEGLKIDGLPDIATLTFSQRWILSEFETCRRSVDKNLKALRLNEAAAVLYQFFWHTYCDWYLEMVKIDWQERKDKNSLACAIFVLERFLHLVHPFMPFITEEIWNRLKEEGLVQDEAKSLSLATWPQAIRGHHQPALDFRFKLLKEAITAIRDLKREFGVPPTQLAKATICIGPGEEYTFFEKENCQNYVKKLSGLAELQIVTHHQRQDMEANHLLTLGEVFLPLAGLFDPAKERDKRNKELAGLETEMAKITVRLKDRQFLKKAPPEVVKREKERLELMYLNKKRIKEQLSFLK